MLRENEEKRAYLGFEKRHQSNQRRPDSPRRLPSFAAVSRGQLSVKALRGGLQGGVGRTGGSWKWTGKSSC